MSLGKGAAAAVAVAGLVCTFDLPAEGTPVAFEGSVTPTKALTQVYFLFGTGVCAGRAYTYKLADALPANQTANFAFSIDVADEHHNSGYREFWSILAIHDDANDGVTVGIESGRAANWLAQNPLPTWDSVPMGSPYTEAAWAQWLRDGLPALLPGSTDLFIYNLPPATFIDNGGTYNEETGEWIPNPPTYPTATLLNFSSATDGGAAAFRLVVPEPGSGVVMLVAGALGVAGRRRGR